MWKRIENRNQSVYFRYSEAGHMISYLQKLSTDHYHFKSKLSTEQIKEKLIRATTDIKTGVRFNTTHDFIGTVSEDGFSIMNTEIGIGSVCVMNGNVKESSELELIAIVHKGFIVLFVCWAVAIGLAFLVIMVMDFSLGSLLYVPLFLFAAIAFRLFIHVVYIISRNKALTKLKTIFELS